MSAIVRSPGVRDEVGAGYLYRSLTPAQASAIATARRAGVRIADLAAEYGVSTRTIYRAMAAADQPVVTVRVDAWVAEYVIGAEGPVRVTAWYPA